MTNTRINPEEFQDPLENFEPKEYSDPLEKALVEEEIEAIRHEPFLKIAADVSIEEAISKLAGLHVACILIEEKGKLVGVLSERDILQRVALEYDDIRKQPVSSVMTDDPIYVYETDSAVTALSVMAMCGYRHVPIVDVNENLTGIVSPQRVIEFLRDRFAKSA